MSRINNALAQKQQSNERKLSLVESIDGNQLENSDFHVEKKRAKSYVTMIVGVGAVLIAVALSFKAYYTHRTKTQAMASVTGLGLTYRELIQTGVQAFNKGDYDTALRGFQGLLKDHGSDPVLLVDIGMTYKKKKDFANAKASYKSALQADGKFSAAYNNLGMLSVEEHDWVAATGYLEKALQADPDQVAALLNLAKLNEQSGNWPLAEDYYARYLEHPKGDASVKKLIQKRVKKLQLLSETEADKRRKQ